MTTITFIKQLSPGVVAVIRNGIRGLWTAGILRRESQCVKCGRQMHVGRAAYRPLNQAGERWQRLCTLCVQQSAVDSVVHSAAKETAPMAKKQARSKKKAPAFGRLKGVPKKGPRSQPLPGHELVRHAGLDGLGEDGAEIQNRMNADKTRLDTIRQKALGIMREKDLQKYQAPGMLFKFTAGRDKLSMKLVEEIVDLGGEPSKLKGEEPKSTETKH